MGADAAPPGAAGAVALFSVVVLAVITTLALLRVSELYGETRAAAAGTGLVPEALWPPIARLWESAAWRVAAVSLWGAAALVTVGVATAGVLGPGVAVAALAPAAATAILGLWAAYHAGAVGRRRGGDQPAEEAGIRLLQGTVWLFAALAVVMVIPGAALLAMSQGRGGTGG